MQTVLVAGGAGFIGTHLCKRLLTENYKVICIDNLVTGDRNNLKDILDNQNFTFLEQDITKSLGKELTVDYIFHLASPASPNKKSPRSYINHPIETLLANSLGTYNLLELAKKTPSKILYVSSSEVYGDPSVSPQSEDYFGNVNPNGIRSVYDEGKRFGEAITASYVREYGLDARIIRVFNTYGPMMQIDDGRVVSNFINQTILNKPITIYGDGSQTRSFCYIDDMVEGLMLAMFSDKTKGEVINLGNPDERKISELATIIKDITSSQSEIVFEDLPEDDPKVRKPDISKAEKLIGWGPKVDIERGVRKTVEYFKSINI